MPAFVALKLLLRTKRKPKGERMPHAKWLLAEHALTMDDNPSWTTDHLSLMVRRSFDRERDTDPLFVLEIRYKDTPTATIGLAQLPYYDPEAVNRIGHKGASTYQARTDKLEALVKAVRERLGNLPLRNNLKPQDFTVPLSIE